MKIGITLPHMGPDATKLLIKWSYFRFLSQYKLDYFIPVKSSWLYTFMTNNDNNLLVRLGIIDEKGEPNVIPLAYYFDTASNKIYINT
jgi:hypothetical protein